MSLVSKPQPPVRYIKLGQNGRWVERSLSQSEIHFGHGGVPHALAHAADRDALIAFFVANGRSPGKAADFAREIIDFYTLGPDAIWITFARGRMWWAKAHPEVVWIGETEDQGARLRRTIEPWRDSDLLGRPLYQNGLSTKLTRVAAYQRTLCAVREPDYLLRKLTGDEEPIVQAATQAGTASRRWGERKKTRISSSSRPSRARPLWCRSSLRQVRPPSMIIRPAMTPIRNGLA